METTLNFYTRLPFQTSLSGSTSYLDAVLDGLRSRGVRVRIFVTAGLCEGRRPWFKLIHPRYDTPDLHVPGYVRFGRAFVRVNSAQPWLTAAELAARRLLGRVAPGLAASLDRALPAAARPGLRHVWDTRPADAREADWIARSLERFPADAVAVNYAFLCPAFDRVRGALRIVVMHDLLSGRQALIEKSGETLDAAPMDEAEEMALLGKADVVLAIQRDEAATVGRRISARVLHVPHVIAARPAQRAQVPGRVLFVGSRILPNVHGLTRFLDTAWPAVLAACPGATLHVAGTVGGAFPDRRDGVTMLGLVDDLDGQYDEAEVCILPVEIGSGLKIKLVEALAHGRACVSTDIGVQGVEAQVQDAVAVAAPGAAFAASIVAVLQEPERRRRMEQAASLCASANFSPKGGLDTLAETIAQHAKGGSR